MESLATVIFERTPKGVAATKSASDEVSRRLRTLLLAVDGRSQVAQYVPFLTAFAPLSEKFAELEEMGYLQRKGGAKPLAGNQFERAQNNDTNAPQQNVKGSTLDSGFATIRDADLTALAANPVAQQKSPSGGSFELELLALARQMNGVANPVVVTQKADALSNDLSQNAATRVAATPFGTSAALATLPDGPGRSSKPALADLLREMERFLSASAGAEALPVVLMLEQIKTLAQLRSALPDYIELVQRYGSQSGQHVERLVSLLDQADA